MIEGQSMIEKEFVPVFCSTWKSTLLRIVPDGVEVRCKSCRGAIHHISRERLEREWAALQELAEPMSKSAL